MDGLKKVLDELVKKDDIEIEKNPFGPFPESSLKKALDVLDEFSQKLHIKNEKS